MKLLPRSSTALAQFTAAATDGKVAPTPRDDGISDAIERYRAEKVTRDAAMRIPAVRRAVHVIAGTISTFDFSAWRGTTRIPDDDPTSPGWLHQPDPDRTLMWSLHKVVEDLIWHDRAYWKVERNIAGQVAYLTRVRVDRVQEVHDPNDIDKPMQLLLDGNRISSDRLLKFDGAGVGGLDRFGADLLLLYVALQDAAGRYADAPLPSLILTNSGDDLDDAEIQALLNNWETARRDRATAYKNDALTVDPIGWNSQELQLVEAREQAALEVARLFGLPASALNAPTNDSLTYSTAADGRRDLLESLRPWMSVVEQTLSLDSRRGVTSGIVTARGTTIKFNSDAYTRDDPTTRMNMWAVALTNQILTLDEVRAQEPLAWT